MTTSCTIPRVTLKPRAEASPDLNLSAGAAVPARAPRPPSSADLRWSEPSPEAHQHPLQRPVRRPLQIALTPMRVQPVRSAMPRHLSCAVNPVQRQSTWTQWVMALSSHVI
jgi:hypothetical protein